MMNENGIHMIQRLAQGDNLTDEELQAVRATMYLIQQTVHPVRDWDRFSWPGEEIFLHQTWPLVSERYEIGSGQFAHGAVKP